MHNRRYTSVEYQKCCGAAPLVVSGSNVYTACANVTSNLHSVPVFFTKSNDGGKTFAHTMIISSPNTNPKTFVVNGNVTRRI
jgi:hypothetical protein